MKCPMCNQELVCGCSACLINFPAKENEKHMLISYTEDTETCPSCSFTQSVDGWADIEIAQLRAEGKWPLHKENK